MDFILHSVAVDPLTHHATCLCIVCLSLSVCVCVCVCICCCFCIVTDKRQRWCQGHCEWGADRMAGLPFPLGASFMAQSNVGVSVTAFNTR